MSAQSHGSKVDPPTDPAVAPPESGTDVDSFLGVKKKPVWRRWAKYWIPALLAVLIAAWLLPSLGKKAPEYLTQPVVERSLDLTVTATGNLRPTNQVQVGSEVSGRVEAVYADVNDRVTRGQVLARINTDVIEDQIKQARATLAAAQASISQAQAGFDVSQAQLGRMREVYRISGGKVPSKVELEQAVAAVNRDRAAVAAARATARANEAQLSSAVTNRDRAVIRSPVSGVVLARQIESGQTVAASFSTPNMFIIAEDISVMQLRVNVDEADVARVAQGQKATFTVDAHPGKRFPAEVERIDQAPTNISAQAATATTGQTQSGNSVVNYEARLAVSNSEGLLRPGMTATATIATASTGKQLLVPNGALRFDPDTAEKEGGSVLNPEIGLQQRQQATIGVGSRQSVHVLNTDGSLRRIEVVTGESDGRMTVVRSSQLKAGMRVVTGRTANGS